MWYFARKQETTHGLELHSGVGRLRPSDDWNGKMTEASEQHPACHGASHVPGGKGERTDDKSSGTLLTSIFQISITQSLTKS